MPAKTHGHAHSVAQQRGHTRTYRIWSNMRSRCTNPRVPHWKNYGGRGITVAPEWSRFENFLRDMGQAPDDLSLDRIDNFKGYCKANCRWATRREQRLNSRAHLRPLTFKGETRLLKDWARHLGIKRATISNRINIHGWSVERALSTSVEEGLRAKGAAFINRIRNKDTGRFS